MPLRKLHSLSYRLKGAPLGTDGPVRDLEGPDQDGLIGGLLHLRRLK